MAIRLSRRQALVAASTLLLAGCGGPPTGGSGGGPGEVVLWYETGLPIADTLTSLVARYNATKPATPVVAQPQPDLSVKLLVVIGAHDAPNIVIYPRSRAWELVSRGVAFPLTDFARRDGVTADAFSPGFWSGGVLKNQLWGLPLGADANILAYNAKLLAEAKVQPAPYWSTSAFLAACAALVKRDSSGHLIQTGAIFDPSVPFAVWLWQQGADILSADLKTPAFNNAAGLKALNWLLASQQTNGGAPEIGRLVSLTTLTEGINGVFNHAKLGIMPSTFSGFFRLKAQTPQVAMHAATLPTIDGGQPATASDIIYAFSPQQATAPNPEGTWQFIRWLATDADAQNAMFGGGIIPALLTAQRSPAIASDPDAQVMLQALKVARTPQDALWEPEVASSLQQEVQKALNGQATAQQALTDASNQGLKTIQADMKLGE
jgi:ABC-type glycerol-3-phosphate transport system substrate-binding protein